MAGIKAFMRDLTPPILYRTMHNIFRTQQPARFNGSYCSFAAAAAAPSVTGYDLPSIGRASAETLHLYRNGFVELDERFQRAHSALSIIADRMQTKKLSVLDVGGANGAHYFILQPLFQNVRLDWVVLETKNTVSACRDIESPVTFTDTMPDRRFDVAFVSGVLQYLPDPAAALAAYARGSKWLVLSRLPVRCEATVTLQTIKEQQAVVACRFFTKAEIEAMLRRHGDIVLSWTINNEYYHDMDADAYGYLIHVRS